MAGISSKAFTDAVENKFKYNSIELNSSLDVAVYDAMYRNLDVQTGRFWQLDPRPSNSNSLYTFAEDNPIYNSDPLGDTVKGNAKLISNYLNGIARGISSTQAQISKQNSLLSSAKAPRKISSVMNKISQLTSRLNSLKDAQTEFNILDKSTQNYRVVSSSSLNSNEEGNLRYDSKSNEVMINVSSSALDMLGTTAHEFKHAYQYQTGGVSLNWDGSGSSELIDVDDEVEAFQRGQAVSTSYHPGVNFSSNMVQQLYPSNSPTPQNINTVHPYVPNSTFGDFINRDNFYRGTRFGNPKVIVIGWQKSYAAGVASGVLKRIQ